MKKREETKGEFFHEVHSSFRILVNNKYELVFPLLSDIFFLLLFGALVYGYSSDSVTNKLYSLGASMLRQDMPGAAVFVRSAIVSLIGMLLLIYILYIIFQAISWRFSSKFAGKKEPLLSYLKRFAIVNIPWFILFVIYLAASFAAYFYNKRSILLSAVLYIFLAAILYFAFISYSLMGKRPFSAVKDALKLGSKKFLRLFPRIFLLFAAIIMIDNILFRISNMSWALMIILGIFIMLPLLTFARIYIHIIVRNISS